MEEVQREMFAFHLISFIRSVPRFPSNTKLSPTSQSSNSYINENRFDDDPSFNWGYLSCLSQHGIGFWLGYLRRQWHRFQSTVIHCWTGKILRLFHLRSKLVSLSIDALGPREFPRWWWYQWRFGAWQQWSVHSLRRFSRSPCVFFRLQDGRRARAMSSILPLPYRKILVFAQSLLMPFLNRSVTFCVKDRVDWRVNVF